MSFRSWLYKMGRLLGDINAIKKGRVKKRIGRRIVGRFLFKWIGKLFK